MAFMKNMNSTACSENHDHNILIIMEGVKDYYKDNDDSKMFYSFSSNNRIVVTIRLMITIIK